MHRRILGLLLVVALVAVVGCGTKDKDKDGKDNKDGGGVEYKTPEEAFEGFQTAAKNKDHKAFVSCLTPDSQEQMTGGLVFSMILMRGMMEGLDKTGEAKKKMQPVTDVLEKHGITDEAVKKLPEPKLDQKEDPSKAMKPLLDQIKDKPAFCAELLGAMEKTGQDKGGGGFAELGAATLEDVKIDGDKATAKVSTDKKKGEPIEFKKIGNGWKIELPKK